MASEPISLSGVDFAQFARSQPKLWLKARGTVVQHPNFGTGTIESVQLRNNSGPLININFGSDSKSFNTMVFESGKITAVLVASTISDLYVAWKEQVAREIAQATAERVREIERREQARVVAEQEARRAAEKKEDFATRVGRPMLEMDEPMFSGLGYPATFAKALSEHYASALPARVCWLRKWAKRIAGGESGLEPQWSLGEAAASHLNAHGIQHLWHFTDVRNLESIWREGGLLSWAGVVACGIVDAHMVADDYSRSCDEALGREHYVRLSYIPNSWFFQRVRGQAPLIWVRFSTRVLAFGEVLYSRGNAASGFAALNEDLRTIDVNWGAVRSMSDNHGDDRGPTRYPSLYQNQVDDPVLFKQLSDAWNSEALIKHFLPIEFCTGVFNSRTGERIGIA